MLGLLDIQAIKYFKPIWQKLMTITNYICLYILKESTISFQNYLLLTPFYSSFSACVALKSS